jgi:quercetin dioxygenase-like cupin family protein
MMTPVRRIFVLSSFALLLAAAATADEPVKRNLLERSEMAGTNLVAVLARVEAAADAMLPRHTHPGVEITTCVSGEMDLLIDGQPPRHIVAGEHFQVPPGVPHAAKFGAVPAVLIASFVVDKDKPLSSPAP